MNFEAYLQNKKYSVVTIRYYIKDSDHFINWLRGEGITADSFTYTELLDFMRSCNAAGITKGRLHGILGVIRHYCNYLIHEGKRNDNPAAGVFIKGLVRKLPTNLLNMEEMEELYKQYSVQLSVSASKKIMFGLMIYQGITVGELMRLEAIHIKLKDGKIFIKGTKRSNERLLNLHASQITELQQYISSNKFKEGYLFIEQRKTLVSEKNINNRIQYMLKQLRQLNPKVINPKQIRSSVITEWLRKNNLRQVQYLAGHKYVSSTERYQTSNLDDLQSELHHHHPMR
jgi:site-specific recombinase XerD